MLQKIKTFAVQRPVIFAVIVILFSIISTEIPLQRLFVPYMSQQAAIYASLIVQQGLVGLGLWWLLRRFGWTRQAGFTPPVYWRVLWLGWPLVVYALLNGSDFLTGAVKIDPKPGVLVLYTLVNLSTGWVEEVMGRGLVLAPILQKWGSTRKGVFAGVLVSSALFGLAHLANLIMGRAYLVNALAQIVYCVFFGVLFAALLLRNRTIWPVMLLHALFDFAGNLGELTPGAVINGPSAPLEPLTALLTVLIFLPLFIYGLVLLRKAQPIPSELPETKTNRQPGGKIRA